MDNTGDINAPTPEGDPTPPVPPRYLFDPNHAATAAAILDHGYGAADRWDVAPLIRDQLPGHGLAVEHPLGLELVRLTYHRLQIDTSRSVSTQLVPLPGPDLVTDEVLALWLAVQPLLSEPAARAAVSDLLWERRATNPIAHARIAINSYLEWADNAAPSLSSTDSTARAWDLARRIKDPTLVERGEVVALRLVSAGLDLDEYNPGVTLPLLNLLTSPPIDGQTNKDEQRTQVSDLLEKALLAYAFHDAGEVIDLMMRGARSQAERAALQSRHLDLMWDQAEDTPNGLLKQIRFQEVIALARTYGRRETADAAIVAIQSIDPKSLGMRSIQSTHTVPIDARESWLDRFTRGRDWRDGLDAFLLSPPPTGSSESLNDETRKYLSAGHLHTIFSTVSLTREGLPSHSSTGNDFAHAKARQAGFSAAIYGEMLATGLRRTAAKHGVPSVKEIRVRLAHRGADDEDLADALARAIRHFWLGDHDSALHVITPRIETAARSLLREMDVAIYRTQVGKSKGGYVGLFSLIENLEKLALDADWAFYLRYALLGPNGMNIRDDVAHGLITRAEAVPTALTLRAASLLILVAGPTVSTDWDPDLDGPPVTTGETRRDKSAIATLLRAPTGAARRSRLSTPASLLRKLARMLVRTAFALESRAASVERSLRRGRG